MVSIIAVRSASDMAAAASISLGGRTGCRGDRRLRRVRLGLGDRLARRRRARANPPAGRQHRLPGGQRLRRRCLPGQAPSPVEARLGLRWDRVRARVRRRPAHRQSQARRPRRRAPRQGRIRASGRGAVEADGIAVSVAPPRRSGQAADRSAPARPSRARPTGWQRDAPRPAPPVRRRNCRRRFLASRSASGCDGRPGEPRPA